MTQSNQPASQGESCCSGSGCCGEGGGASPVSVGTSRRGFLKATGLVGLGVMAGPIVAGPFVREARGETAAESLIPLDKKLNPDWVKALFAKGERKVYRNAELTTIGMPVGGVAAGQVYLSGDGRLACWDVFNHTPDTGPGSTRYVALKLEYPFDQGFVVRAGGMERTLDRKGFPKVTFAGEYPLAWVTYEAEDFPVRVVLEAFSPFVPLNAADSALPATVMRFRLENMSGEDVEAEIVGRLENPVALYSKDSHSGWRVNRVIRSGKGTTLACGVEARPEDAQGSSRPPIVFEDFETDYSKWKITGEGFGSAPATGTIPPQQKVSGWVGKGLVNTFLKGDDSKGRAVSVEFEIERPFINFLIGGGRYPKKAYMQLVVDGKPVRSATGRNSEQLEWQTWAVKSLIGTRGHLEIVDDVTGPWGHINVDQIEFSDRPASGTPELSGEPDVGTMALAVMGEGRGNARAGSDGDEARVDLQDTLTGEVARHVSAKKGGSAEVTFVVAWHFANHADRGQYYATRFQDAAAVADYVLGNFDRLDGETKLWHATYYDSTLPHWFLDRVHMPVSNLATGTCQWWQNGRFWAWEGVGCCHGTCTHVWNYAQGMARLFPELERSAREMQDFGAGFHEDGLVGFRGGSEYAADGQAGTVLKAYREHLMSKDDAFLRRNWPRIKKAIEFLIAHDANDDGLIEDPQHNTYDIWFHGPNTFVGALYLAALRASEEMGKWMGDAAFAAKCRRIFEAGSKWSDQKLFDGEYYFQIVDLKEHPEHQYDHGCLSDQLFGQNWAAQLGLGYVYRPENVRKGLESVYKYNWTPDVGAYSEKHPPGRWYARAGEAGLITCTFPKSQYLTKGVLYREEVWTGIEYQVASHMIHEGMLEEAFAIVRGVHERYDGTKHNPWNEIECGDHYARALASWACLTAVSGFQYDGPAGKLAFAPKLTPEDFKCAFTTAEGWGTFAQQGGRCAVRLKWGELMLNEFRVSPQVESAHGASMTLNGKAVDVRANDTHGGLVLTFDRLHLKAGDELVVSVG